MQKSPHEQKLPKVLFFFEYFCFFYELWSSEFDYKGTLTDTLTYVAGKNNADQYDKKHFTTCLNYKNELMYQVKVHCIAYLQAGVVWGWKLG